MTVLPIHQESQAEVKQLDHFSFSAMKDWDHCPHYFKVKRIDRLLPFEGNIHTAFGKAVHKTQEVELLSEKPGCVELDKLFLKEFEKELAHLDTKQKYDIVNEPSLKKLHTDMLRQGQELAQEIIPALDAKFEDGYEVFGVEESLYEIIDFYDESEWFLKGYIDLVVKTKDNRYHIIDWKVTGWGWTPRQRADAMTGYQLALYKHFFCKKYKIDPDRVDTYFVLCKRTIPKDPKERIEFVPITTGKKKVENAINLLNTAVYNVDHGNHMKKRTNCWKGKNTKCSLYKTKLCP